MKKMIFSDSQKRCQGKGEGIKKQFNYASFVNVISSCDSVLNRFILTSNIFGPSKLKYTDQNTITSC